MDAFLQILRNIGTMRLGAMAGVAVGLIAFFIYLTTRLATPNMALLYGDLDPADSGQIVAQLESRNVPYEMRKSGSEVFVPADRVGELRLSMAGAGLPNRGDLGYGLLDREESIGTSSAMQELNRKRALEGEIARTISSLGPVKGARVLLVLPRRQLFTRDRQEASASIAIKMRGATRLDRNQVLAIQHLVAAAVPGLQPNRISIVDDRGTLLARGGDPEGTRYGGMNPTEVQAEFEGRLSEKVTELLERTVGFGNARVEVRAQLDFDRIETNQEIFDPESQVVRSTQAIEESAQERAGPPDAVSVGQNLPDADIVGGAEESQRLSNRAEEATNFEISRTVRNHVREVGKIERLSVAVLVDGRYRTADDGTVAYEARTAEELDQIAKLARSAVGFDAERGDTIEIVNLRFADPPADLEGSGTGRFFGFERQDLLRLAEVVVLGLVGILVILLVVRPLISRIFEASAAAAEAIAQSTEKQMLTDQRPGAPALAGPAGTVPAAYAGGAMVAAGAAGGPEEEESMINLANIEGRVKASSLRKIGEIIDRHPEEAVSIMRNWMYQER